MSIQFHQRLFCVSRNLFFSSQQLALLSISFMTRSSIARPLPSHSWWLKPEAPPLAISFLHVVQGSAPCHFIQTVQWLASCRFFHWDLCPQGSSLILLYGTLPLWSLYTTRGSSPILPFGTSPLWSLYTTMGPVPHDVFPHPTLRHLAVVICGLSTPLWGSLPLMFLPHLTSRHLATSFKRCNDSPLAASFMMFQGFVPCHPSRIQVV